MGSAIPIILFSFNTSNPYLIIAKDTSVAMPLPQYSGKNLNPISDSLNSGKYLSPAKPIILFSGLNIVANLP